MTSVSHKQTQAANSHQDLELDLHKLEMEMPSPLVKKTIN